MNIFTVSLLLIAVIYGGLTVLVGGIQLKQKKINIWASLLMIIGGLLIAISVILNFLFSYYTFYFLILSLILIHIAAINNGYKIYGKINIKHHIIRLAISILIIILYVIK